MESALRAFPDWLIYIFPLIAATISGLAVFWITTGREQKIHATMLFHDLISIQDYFSEKQGSSHQVRHAPEWQKNLAHCPFLTAQTVQKIYRIYDCLYDYNHREPDNDRQRYTDVAEKIKNNIPEVIKYLVIKYPHLNCTKEQIMPKPPIAAIPPINASEVGATAITISSGYLLNNYLLLMKKTNHIPFVEKTPEIIDTLTQQTDAWTLIIATMALMLASMVTLFYKSINSFFEKLGQYVDKLSKPLRLLAISPIVLLAGFFIFYPTPYTILAALFMLTLCFIASKQLTTLAVFSLSYLSLSFLILFVTTMLE